jgi:hypothetical protein
MTLAAVAIVIDRSVEVIIALVKSGQLVDHWRAPNRFVVPEP